MDRLSLDWDCSVTTYQLQDQHAPTRPFVALTFYCEVRQSMSAVADSLPNNVTNLRDVIDVPVPVIDVGDSSLRVPTLELSGILSINSVMIPVAPVALPMPEMYLFLAKV